MRCLNRNKQKMYYSLLLGETVKYARDANGNKIVDWTDSQGIPHYRETGTKSLLYSEPIEFKGNIAMSGGDVDRTEFGVDMAKYEAVLVTNKDSVPLTETSILWYKTTPVTYKIDDKTYADASSADYKVLKISPSLNVDRFILDKVVK